MTGPGAGDDPPEAEQRRWVSRSTRHRRRRRLEGFEFLQHKQRKRALRITLWVGLIVGALTAVALLMPY